MLLLCGSGKIVKEYLIRFANEKTQALTEPPVIIPMNELLDAGLENSQKLEKGP